MNGDPQIIEGMAPGPGGLDMPPPLQPGFDPGQGFDPELLDGDDLPIPVPQIEGGVPEAMPFDGNSNTGVGPSVQPLSAEARSETRPITETQPVASTPIPNQGFDRAVPDNSILTLRTGVATGPREALPEEVAVARPSPPIALQPADIQPTIQPTESQLAESQPAEPQMHREEVLKAEPVAPEPVASAAYTNGPAVGGSVVEREPSAFEQVRQTAYESPAEPWAVPKSWKSRRTHEDNLMPGSTDGWLGELQHPGSRQPKFVAGDEEMAAPPEPEGLKDDQVASVGLDGYCPVDLVRGETWTLGDPRFAVEFEGRIYRMCGPEQHRAFRSNPERYAPVNGGNDPVLSFEENTRKAGRTESCAVFEGRLYMFSGPDSLARFQTNPGRYTRGLQRSRK